MRPQNTLTLSLHVDRDDQMGFSTASSTRISLRPAIGWLAACALACALTGGRDLEPPAWAPPDRIPLEAFVSAPKLENPKLSPSGRYLAGVRLVDGYPNLVRTDLETGTSSPITAYENDALYDFAWASEDRILFSASFKGDRLHKLFAIDADGTGLLDFAERRNRRDPLPPAASQQFGDMIVSLLSGDREHVLVAYRYPVLRPGPAPAPAPAPGAPSRPAAKRAIERDWVASDVYKLDIYTGRALSIVHSDLNPYVWFATDDGEVRIGAGTTPQGKTFFVYREDSETSWRPIGPDAGKLSEATFSVLGVSDDPGKIYVKSRHESDRFALYLYDVRSGQFSAPLFAHPWADVDGPLVYAAAKPGEAPRVIGVEYLDHFRRIHWLDAEWQALSDTLDASLPGSVNTVVSRSGDDQRLLIYARSDRDPGTYYLYKRKEGQLVALSKLQPELPADARVEVRPVSFKARDGLEIQGYLALPRGAEGRRVPVIVQAHGGARFDGRRDSLSDHVLYLSSRNTQEPDGELQLLANRGWAVFRPNFRGSTGLGLELQKRGHRQLGRAIQDDITDGVRWLIDSGIADPARICIHGAELGGLASVAALVRTPELFACGAALGGIFNLDAFLASRAYFVDLGVLDAQIGNRSRDAAQLAAVSPRLQAPRLEGPVFLAHYTEDGLVPVDQSMEMAGALSRAGKPHHLLVLDDSPDAGPREALRLRYYRNLEAFFYQHLGAADPAPR